MVLRVRVGVRVVSSSNVPVVNLKLSPQIPSVGSPAMAAFGSRRGGGEPRRLQLRCLSERRHTSRELCGSALSFCDEKTSSCLFPSLPDTVRAAEKENIELRVMRG